MSYRRWQVNSCYSTSLVYMSTVHGDTNLPSSQAPHITLTYRTSPSNLFFSPSLYTSPHSSPFSMSSLVLWTPLVPPRIVPRTIRIPIPDPVLPPSTAYAKAHHKARNKQRDRSGKRHPHGIAERRRGAEEAAIVVDVVACGDKEAKVDGHGDEGYDECEEAEEG